MTANRHATNLDRRSYRRQGARARWPDTTLARAYLTALTKWAVTHHENIEAKVTLPIGIVGAGEVLKVLHALEKAQRTTEHRA